MGINQRTPADIPAQDAVLGGEHAGVSKQVCITPVCYGTTFISSHRHVMSLFTHLGHSTAMRWKVCESSEDHTDFAKRIGQVPARQNNQTTDKWFYRYILVVQHNQCIYEGLRAHKHGNLFKAFHFVQVS